VIKFQDLSRLHATIAADLRTAFERTLANSEFVQGEAVATFERDFGAFTGASHCIGVGNGTDALELALEALDLPAGGVVIVPSMTFAATAEAVVRQGLRPHFADVDPGTLCVGARQMREAIATAPAPPAACIIVHLYGRGALPPDLLAVLNEARIPIIEDCAQAHGARSAGRHVGLTGVMGCFSFYPGKNLGALGDAGALVTGRADLAERVLSLRDHGRQSKYLHAEVGRNSRLDGLQAAFLSVKLRHLEAWTASRRAVARVYDEGLRGCAALLPLLAPADVAEHVYHLYVVRVQRRGGRDETLRQLQSAGIGCGVHYPVPLHRQPAFERFSDRDLAHATQAAAEVLSLPMDPLMREDEAERVCDVLRALHA
jgi:dTDP-4-amino-4,6-dideoxygalactose transaminase